MRSHARLGMLTCHRIMPTVLDMFSFKPAESLNLIVCSNARTAELSSFINKVRLFASWVILMLLRIDTGDRAWKAFEAKQALLDNTSCGYIHVVYNK